VLFIPKFTENGQQRLIIICLYCADSYSSHNHIIYRSGACKTPTFGRFRPACAGKGFFTPTCGANNSDANAEDTSNLRLKIRYKL